MGRKNASRTKRRNSRTKARLREHEYGKLFNGNVYGQWEFVFIWGLILALLLGLWFYIFSDTFPITDENCISTVFVVTNSEISGGGAVFKDGSSGKNYKLDGGYFDIERFSAEASEGDVLSAVISHGKVVSLSKGESVYISIDDMKDLHERLRPVSYLVLAIAGVWFLYIAVSWYVMYNAERFPRLIRFFVKPEYINKSKVYKKQRKGF
ncbi:MAG: hypothetical protein K2J73_02320 [Oscillospiraceae bacterium]|nr:hypothetical protein [Oscillospiraceae bacterium]